MERWQQFYYVTFAHVQRAIKQKTSYYNYYYIFYCPVINGIDFAIHKEAVGRVLSFIIVFVV